MNRRIDKPTFCWIALGAWVIASLACGKRGDPLPPLRRLPDAVKQVRVWQRGPFIHIEWKAPSRNTDGSAEVELEEAQVLRRVVEIPPAPVEAEAAEPEGEEEPAPAKDEEAPSAEPQGETADRPPQAEGKAPETAEESEEQEESETGQGEEQAPQPALPPPFPAGAEEIATLDSTQADELLTFRDPLDPSWEGKRVEYGVRHINRKGRRSGLSLIVHIDPLPPLPPPKDLTAEVEAGLVRLRWSSGESASAAAEDAIPFGYNVYRRGESELFPARPLHPKPLLVSSYEDSSVVFGQAWCYAVRRVALSEQGGSEAAIPLIESVLSEEVCLTPIDTFPPPRPENLVAVASPEGVLLSWSAVVAPDVKGYLVYRAMESEGPFELLTREPVTAASYTDGSAQPGTVFYYNVSAVDRIEPWNESPHSEPVSIRVPDNR